MKRCCLAIAAVLLLALPANAWNDAGHMIVARLAWQKLTKDERAVIVKLLEKHPHYTEFLKAKKPSNMTQDEWVFLRAATWADWVRSGPGDRKKFSIPAAHFIDHPFVDPDSKAKAPEMAKVNAVAKIEESKKTALDGSGEDVAVALTWLFHLVGDVHQPLHCVSYYSDTFPQGDKGGNRAEVRIGEGRPFRLHGFWDGLLGKSTTRSAIMSVVVEVEETEKNSPDLFKTAKDAEKTPMDWSKEGFELAKSVAYLDGKLNAANGDNHPTDDQIPSLKEAYAEKAGETARFCVGKAGIRLAAVLREVAKKNGK